MLANKLTLLYILLIFLNFDITVCSCRFFFGGFIIYFRLFVVIVLGLGDVFGRLRGRGGSKAGRWSPLEGGVLEVQGQGVLDDREAVALVFLPAQDALGDGEYY